MLRQPSTSVPFSDTSPRLYEVALLMCGTLIVALRDRSWMPSGVDDCLTSWYLGKVASLTQEDASVARIMERLSERQHISNWEPRPDAWSDAHPAGRNDVDFVAALQHSMVPQGHIGGDNVNDGVAVHMDGLGFCTAAGQWRTSTNSASPAFCREDEDATAQASTTPHDGGFALLLQFAFLCQGAGVEGVDARSVIDVFLKCMRANQNLSHQRDSRVAPGAETDAAGRSVVDVATLDLYFVMDGELQNDSVLALGSLIESFHVVMCISWSCASFQHQTRIAEAVSGWVTALSRVLAHQDAYNRVRAIMGESSQSRREHQRTERTMEEGGGESLHLTRLSGWVRKVFEEGGHLGLRSSTPTDPAVEPWELSAPEQAPQGLPTLVSLQDIVSAPFVSLGLPWLVSAPENSGGGAGAVTGTQPVLHNIANGLLIYIQIHLSLRSLEAARRCADMAVLVSHQLHSDNVLAVAQYTKHVVCLVSGDVHGAVDSLALALQLSMAALHVEGAMSGVEPPTTLATWSRYTTASRVYGCAAELLMGYPGAVSSSLRACLENESPTLVVLRRWAASGSSDGADEGRLARSAAGGSGAANEAHTERALRTPTIAETARNALWAAETFSFFAGIGRADDPAAGALSLTTTLRQETQLLLGSLYGMQCHPLRITADLLRPHFIHGGPDVRTAGSAEPGLGRQLGKDLLAEAVRHTGHTLLALLDGRVRGSGDLRASTTAVAVDQATVAVQVALDFIAAVEETCGADGVAFVEGNVFFATAVRLCALTVLWRRGFATAAYDGMRQLAVGLYRYSGLADLAAHAGHLHGEEEGVLMFLRSASVAQKAASADGKPRAAAAADSSYWPLDHLLLLAAVQMRRAEVGAFLVYTGDLAIAAATLELLGATRSFLYGVLASRYVHVLRLHSEGNHSGAVSAAQAAVDSCRAVRLSSLSWRIMARGVSALMAGGEWAAALAQLAELQQAAPWDAREWATVSHINTACELLGQLQRQAGDGDGGVAGDLDASVRHFAANALSVLEAQDCFSDHRDGSETPGRSLLDSLSVHATVVRLIGESGGKSGAGVPTRDAAYATVTRLAQMLRSRQYAGHAVTRQLNSPSLAGLRDALVSDA